MYIRNIQIYTGRFVGGERLMTDSCHHNQKRHVFFTLIAISIRQSQQAIKEMPIDLIYSSF